LRRNNRLSRNRRHSAQPLGGRAITVVENTPGTDGTALRGALLDSRQRWRDLVSLATDIAFETDQAGQFVFLMPDKFLGWPAGSLLGKPADPLLAAPGGVPGFDPFRTPMVIRGRRSWLYRADGSLACLSFSCAPLLDATGTQIGTRGVATDDSTAEGQQAKLAAACRRGDLVAEILGCLRREVLGQDMINSTLAGLVRSLGAEGACVLDTTTGPAAATLLYRMGDSADIVRPAIDPLLQTIRIEDTDISKLMLDHVLPDGRLLLIAGFLTPYGDQAAMALWRAPGDRHWDHEERVILGSISGVMGVLLSHAALQQAMANQASTDPLTGLLNRRTFLGELPRRLSRLVRDGEVGSLLFADLDNFKEINDQHGHDAGDRALVKVAEMLSAALRPTDLVARLGGDEFAIWMDGVDHMTAAERAEALCLTVPEEVAAATGVRNPMLGLSVGIAAQNPDGGDSAETLLRRADHAMYEVKRAGRGHWRVSHKVPA
jgi:diguanylate cyclase (GGDEF)-like protein